MATLLLSIACWLLPARVLPTSGDEELERLRERLEAPAERTRRSAVRALAELGGEDAWELVVQALGDPAGIVAEEAEWRLGREAPCDVLAALLGRDGLGAREERVARRAATALGLSECALDGEALGRGLDGRLEELSAALLGLLERRAGELGGERERILRDVRSLARRTRVPRLRAAALTCAARFVASERERTELARDVRRASEEDARELRIAALLAAEVLDASERAELLARAAADPDPAVRLQAADGARARGDRIAAGVLVARLDAEDDPRVRWRVVGALQRMSGLLHRDDPRPWRDWCAALPADWRGADAEPRREGGGPVSRASLAGLPILSGRVAFLVDFSGSLWMERADGTIRKTFADAALRAAIEGLPDDARFNLIPYTSTPHPWRPELVRATSRNKRDAIEWFEACRERGSGDFEEAARLALEDPDVDTILSFTDGLPTGGERNRLELLVPELLERVRFRRVAFDTLLVGAPARLHRHWRRLAEESGGLLRTVDG